MKSPTQVNVEMNVLVKQFVILTQNNEYDKALLLDISSIDINIVFIWC